jgi:hypothetical protein
MRRTHPDANRPFRCPAVPLIPALGVLFCMVLMFSLPSENWLRLFVWLAIGLVIYWFYGRHHSVMACRRAAEAEEKTPARTRGEEGRGAPQRPQQLTLGEYLVVAGLRSGLQSDTEIGHYVRRAHDL